jgi:hypothetical protein
MIDGSQEEEKEESKECTVNSKEMSSYDHHRDASDILTEGIPKTIFNRLIPQENDQEVNLSQSLG